MLSILVLLTKKWYSSFLKVCIFQKIYVKVKGIEIVQKFQWLSHKSMSISQMEILKILILKESMLFLLALKWNIYEKAFSCVKTKTNFCTKPCWNAERSNHSFLSNWSSALFNYVAIYRNHCVNIGKRSGAAKLVFK